MDDEHQGRAYLLQCHPLIIYTKTRENDMYFDPQDILGEYSATFTPYDKNDEVNVAMLEKIVEFHIRSGLKGFYLTGNTGECHLLSPDERKLVVESVAKFNRGRAKIIVHVGHDSTDTAMDLARHAAKCGADAVSALALRGGTFDHAYRHYSRIAGSTDLPFLIYSVRENLTPDRDVKLFDIPNVRGMKYTGFDFFGMQQLIGLLDKPCAFFSGSDQLFLAGLCFGAGGSIGTSQNFAPREFVRIFELFQQGRLEEARELQAKINKVIYLMLEDGDRSYTKAIMRYIGFDCGNCRLPHKQLTQEEYAAFAKRLENLAVLEVGS